MNGRKLLCSLVAAVGAASANAAEWSVAPSVAWLVDHASNRVLREGTSAGESVGASLDVPLVRRSETGELRIATRYHGQRFTDGVMPDVDDLQLLAHARHDFERARVEFNGEAARQSTLSTELAETGVIRAGSNRRTYAASAGWQFAHSEERSFDASIAFQDIGYTGDVRRELVGYRYSTLRAGETFRLSSRSAILVTAFGSDLRGGRGGPPDREHGLQLGFSHAWSERLSMSASVGASRRDAGAGADDEVGGTGDLSLEHRGERTEWSLQYSHGLVPYGTGVLVERDSAQLRVSRDFGPRLSASLRAGLARNDDGGIALNVDTRDYRFSDAELRLAMTETWNVALAGGFRQASDDEAAPVDGWNVALRMRWAPRAQVLGH